jgi:nicotinate-nucleotide adenylyltransferase
MHHIAIFGGTFDPVHNGHLQTNLAIQSHFHFDDYYFLPCKIPALKPPTLANTTQRIDMLALAIKPFKNFHIDLREIYRDSPSYMVETLQNYRLEYADASITLIMGYDAFLSLPKWYQWEKIITLANLLVINRNQYSDRPIPDEIKALLTAHQSLEKRTLLKASHGVIYEFDAGDYPISSTEIRDQLQRKLNIETKLPKEVYEYIKQWGLYQ